MSVGALAANGVVPLTVEAAILHRWRLTFNVPPPFPSEGCFANVEPAPGSAVHGVLCELDDKHLSDLDRFEANGIVYGRLEPNVSTYGGGVRAC